ncbi:MAG: DUF2442 domain-containing protein [Candidatus Methylumidiphilus sp.]
MGILLDVMNVQAQPGYKLVMHFENGELRRFDMSPYMDRKPWVNLKNSPLFYRARVEYGTVVWPGEIDIDPETLYELSELIEPSSLDAENC